MTQKFRSHRDLDVYCKTFNTAMTIFDLSRKFPKEETYALTDQVRRSSRSLCANLAEAWRKRCYRKSFRSKLIDAEAEAAETQVWLEFAVNCEYLDRDRAAPLYQTYHDILGTLVGMKTHANTWVVEKPSKPRPARKG